MSNEGVWKVEGAKAVAALSTAHDLGDWVQLEVKEGFAGEPPRIHLSASNLPARAGIVIPVPVVEKIVAAYMRSEGRPAANLSEKSRLLLLRQHEEEMAKHVAHLIVASSSQPANAGACIARDLLRLLDASHARRSEAALQRAREEVGKLAARKYEGMTPDELVRELQRRDEEAAR